MVSIRQPGNQSIDEDDQHDISRAYLQLLQCRLQDPTVGLLLHDESSDQLALRQLEVGNSV